MSQKRFRLRGRTIPTHVWSLVVILVLVALIATLSVTLTSHDEDAHPESISKRYKAAAIVSDHENCSQIGRDIMRDRGGSAVDAAIATLLCVGATSAQASGIGGGHFMVIYDTRRNGTEKEVLTIDARETAPGAATVNMFQNKSVTGPLSIAVPGEVKGLHEAWKLFGRLPWRDLVEPTIRLCRTGFKVTEKMAEKARMKLAKLEEYPDLRLLLLKPDGTPYGPGDIMKRPVLAATLQRLIDDGPGSFYTGRVAEDIINDLRDAGAIITSEDLSQYEAKVKPPLVTSLVNGTWDMYTPTLPSGGPLLLFMLKILEGFKVDFESPDQLRNNVDLHQILVETFKFGYAMRSYLRDEDQSKVTEFLQNMTSDWFIEHTRRRIDLAHTHDVAYYGADYLTPDDHGTGHVSVVAPDGAAVSVTTSINFYFGSLVYGKRSGIIFNNEMGDFSSPKMNDVWQIRPSRANLIAPGKRPLSSMSPVVVLDRKTKLPRLVSGGAGGGKITTITAMTTYLNLMLGLDMKNVVDFPRVHSQLLPNRVTYEESVNEHIISGLRDKGHNMVPMVYTSVMYGIERRCDVNSQSCYFNAVGDHRRGSKPDGWD